MKFFSLNKTVCVSCVGFLCMLFYSTNLWAPPRITLQLGGAKFIKTGNDLSCTITVDATVPAVFTGQVADQMFVDDVAGAAYFGYYLTLGVRTQDQVLPNVNIKVSRGLGATLGRSYYLVGNGVTTPSTESNLTAAPLLPTTFATATSETRSCGPNASSNGVNLCNNPSSITVPNMDVTQFVKVLYVDNAGTPIFSELDFIAVVE